MGHLGVGLAHIKPEGHAVCPGEPEIGSWPHYYMDFVKYFHNKYNSKWIPKFIKDYLFRVASSAWQEALYFNAKKTYEKGSQQADSTTNIVD